MREIASVDRRRGPGLLLPGWVGGARVRSDAQATQLDTGGIETMAFIARSVGGLGKVGLASAIIS